MQLSMGDPSILFHVCIELLQFRLRYLVQGNISDRRYNMLEDNVLIVLLSCYS